MEFLYRLYSNDYFGIGLFIAITILAFSFLVILFFGKKDEKIRNQENEKNTSNNNETNELKGTEGLPTESLEAVSLSVETINEIKEEKVEQSVEMNPFIYSNVVLNSDLVETSESEKNQEPVIETGNEALNFSNNDIFENKITEELSELNIKEEKIEEKQEEFNIDPFNMEPPIIEPVQNNIFTDFAEKEEKKEQPIKKVVMPTQFSSVYLTKEKEQPKIEEPIKEVEAEKEITPIPLKPDFDLPKPLDLPKLNKESGSSSALNENIFNTNNNNGLNNIFENIEEESYTINK